MKKETKQERRQSKNHSLVCYDKKRMLEVIEDHKSVIKHYAYATHDLDVEEDGKTLKKEHTHLILQLNNNYLESTIRNWFKNDKEEHTALNQKVSVLASAFDYLTHKNNPEKTQYNDEIVVCDNNNFWRKGAKEDNLLLAMQDLLDGITVKECMLKYGRDFIIHYRSIKLLLNDVTTQQGGLK